MHYSFDELLRDLKTGREIEFEYRGQSCAIVNENGKWFFFINSQGEELCDFEDKDILLQKAAALTVCGNSLEEIINQELYAGNTLFIL